MAEAQVTEARGGPAAALGHLRQLCADLEARPGLLIGDPTLAPWVARTALAAGDGGLAACAAQALADTHPGYPALAAADGFYYVANAGSADLSEYTVAADGTPSLVAPVAAQTGTGSIDLTASATRTGARTPQPHDHRDATPAPARGAS